MTLHQQIDESLKLNPEGWCSVEKAHVMADCVMAMGGGTVCELGLYTGRSFFPMAMAIKHLKHGVALGIDPFDAAASAEGEEKANAEWWLRLDHNRVEHVFREHLAELELEQWTEIIKDRSENVVPPAEIVVLHVDGQHMEKAVADVTRYAANVVIGGFCMMDDLSWDGGMVSKAVDVLCALGFVERRRLIGAEEGTVYQNDWALFQRTHHC